MAVEIDKIGESLEIELSDHHHPECKYNQLDDKDHLIVNPVMLEDTVVADDQGYLKAAFFMT